MLVARYNISFYLNYLLYSTTDITSSSVDYNLIYLGQKYKSSYYNFTIMLLL